MTWFESSGLKKKQKKKTKKKKKKTFLKPNVSRNKENAT